MKTSGLFTALLLSCSLPGIAYAQNAPTPPKADKSDFAGQVNTASPTPGAKPNLPSKADVSGRVSTATPISPNGSGANGTPVTPGGAVTPVTPGGAVTPVTPGGAVTPVTPNQPIGPVGTVTPINPGTRVQGGVSGGAVNPTNPAVVNPGAPTNTQVQTSAEVDRRMLVALEDEFGVRRQSQGTVAPSGRTFVVSNIEEEEEEDWARIRFTLSYWAAELDDAKISGANSGVMSRFDPANRGIGDYEPEGTAVYEFEIGFHPVISLVASYYQVNYQSNQALNQNIVFGGRGFASGSNVESEIELTSAEAYISVHAVRSSCLRLDLMLGGRYFKSEVSYASDDASVTQSLEAITPTIGLGLVVTPIESVELYGRFLGGGIEYGSGRKRNSDPNRKIDERSLAVATFDFGVRINYQNNFGVALGVRADSFEFERNRGNQGVSKFEGTVGGPYFSIFLGF